MKETGRGLLAELPLASHRAPCRRAVANASPIASSFGLAQNLLAWLGKCHKPRTSLQASMGCAGCTELTLQTKTFGQGTGSSYPFPTNKSCEAGLKKVLGEVGDRHFTNGAVVWPICVVENLQGTDGRAVGVKVGE